MFPRIQKSTKKGKSYEYLVISQSIHKKGLGSTTKNIANLGNIKKFKNQDIQNLIDGLIRIFQLEEYALSNDIEIIESSDYGSIIFWQKIWDDLNLSGLIKSCLKKINKSRVQLEVERYVEMMTINRCMEPLSKLGVSRWVERTCFKDMQGYHTLSSEVNYYYRSMDCLLAVKDELEHLLFEKLKELFSINVKLTFYDITSTFFYTENCSIGKNGYSRDDLPKREQIVVGVVTSYEGYPIKHYVFEGNTKDETTVQEVIKTLQKEFHIEETTFVGDRGMITKLNMERLLSEGYDYIMGVKGRQDEIVGMFISGVRKKWENSEEYKNLKIREERVKVKDFLLWKTWKILRKENIEVNEDQFGDYKEIINNLKNDEEADYSLCRIKLKEATLSSADNRIIQKIVTVIKKYNGSYEDEYRYIICLNNERKESSKKRRDEYIKKISTQLDEVFFESTKKNDHIEVERNMNKIFEGYKSSYRKYFEIKRNSEDKRAVKYEMNTNAIEAEENMDGVFILKTNRYDIENVKVVESYKNLKEVEVFFDDFKNFVDVRPIRHWLEDRVRSHVFICILALLLKRIVEINYLNGKAITEVLEEISKSKLVRYKIKFSEKENREKVFLKVTNTTTLQKKYFRMVGIKNPENLEKFIW